MTEIYFDVVVLVYLNVSPKSVSSPKVSKMQVFPVPARILDQKVPSYAHGGARSGLLYSGLPITNTVQVQGSAESLCNIPPDCGSSSSEKASRVKQKIKADRPFGRFCIFVYAAVIFEHNNWRVLGGLRVRYGYGRMGELQG